MRRKEYKTQRYQPPPSMMIEEEMPVYSYKKKCRDCVYVFPDGFSCGMFSILCINSPSRPLFTPRNECP